MSTSQDPFANSSSSNKSDIDDLLSQAKMHLEMEKIRQMKKSAMQNGNLIYKSGSLGPTGLGAKSTASKPSYSKLTTGFGSAVTASAGIGRLNPNAMYFDDGSVSTPKKKVVDPNLTWKCEVCKKTRRDADISVHTYQIPGFKGAERNVKYCNDNMQCFKGAKEIEFNEEVKAPPKKAEKEQDEEEFWKDVADLLESGKPGAMTEVKERLFKRMLQDGVDGLA